MANVIEKVTLKNPIGKGDKKITQLEIRKPQAGELRGIAMTDVYRMDVEAYDVLLPRIATPTLNKNQIGEMSFEDISEIMGKVVGFLETSA